VAGSRLQKAPLGLLGLFDLKTLGDNPSEFGTTVSPSTDVTDLYAQDLQQVPGVAGTGLTLNSLMTLTVPNGVVWRVLNVFADVTLNVADVALDSTLVLFADIAGAGVAFEWAAYDATAVNNVNRRIGKYFDRPLVLRPGERLNAVLDFTPSVAATGNLRALVHAIPM